MKNILVFFALAITLFSCNGTTSAHLTETSENGKVKIDITASRSNVLDPFKVNLSVKAYDFKEGKLAFEIMADDLNEKNVQFKWQDQNNCLIIIEERDNRERTFQLIASENQVQLGEI
jgi:hypothetical protein